MREVVIDFKLSYSKQTTLEVVRNREEILVKKHMENKEETLLYKKKKMLNPFKRLNKIKIILKIVI